MTQSCLLTAEAVTVPSHGGRLAGELAYGDRAPTFAAVVLNPHPFMGGSMNNRLVVALASELAKAGGASLRFDYGGVGNSDGDPVDVAAAMAQFWATGHAPADPLMQQDAAAAIAWMRQTVDAPLVVIGYSFGAHLAAVTAPEDTAAVVLISPTLTRHEFTAVEGKATPLLVIYSDNDFATPVNLVQGWLARLNPCESSCIRGAEHFFKGREQEVATAVGRFVRPRIAEGAP